MKTTRWTSGIANRVGRNNNEILVQWQNITKEIGADILVLDMDLLDTRAKNGKLTEMLITDVVLQIMTCFAQTERESIHQRQAESITAARARASIWGGRQTRCRMALSPYALSVMTAMCRRKRQQKP